MAAFDLIQQKGKTLLILSPSTERLTLGVGADSRPAEFPQVVAYRLTRPATRATSTRQGHETARQEAFYQARLALGLTHETEQRCTVRRVAVPDPIPDTPAADAEPRLLTGDAVLALPSENDFRVVYPFCVGGLDPTRSASQLRTDLDHIWTAALTERLNLNRAQFPDYGVVLIVPDDFGLGDVEVLVTVLFEDLCFKEIVIHSNSTAAAFGQGISGGCIVAVEDQSVTISCLEDGVLMPESLYVLPFGGSHIAQALHWMLQDALPSGFRPTLSPSDRRQLTELRDARCFLPHEGTDGTQQNQQQSSFAVGSGRGEEGEIRELDIGSAACIAPMGLFYPSLLLPHAAPVLESARSASEGFYSEVLSDSENSKPSSAGPSPVYSALPLDRAIVQSISAVNSVDHRRRFYTSILIVGPCSRLKGLPDMLERCVLSALPPDEVIDTVAVIESKGPSQEMLWKGGVVLGCLSDSWVRREEWLGEGKPNKFGKRDIARSRVYWMFKTETGTI